MAADAGAAGTVAIGDRTVARMGFGAMRVTGAGVWGDPPDREAALALLRRVPQHGITLVDTADSYGPDVSEALLAEALAPYGDVVVATKGGLARTGPDVWLPLGRPEYLIQQAHKSRRRLRVERIALWQLHKIDPAVPRDEQFGAIRRLLDEGVIACAGLSNVSVEDIEAAERVFPVATVQNRYNLADRAHEAVLRHCEARGIAFIPWYPLGKGALARPGTTQGSTQGPTHGPTQASPQAAALDAAARRHGATRGQIALAWLLRRSPMMLPIPGTASPAHLEENVAAAAIALTDGEFAEIGGAAAC